MPGFPNTGDLTRTSKEAVSVSVSDRVTEANFSEAVALQHIGPDPIVTAQVGTAQGTSLTQGGTLTQTQAALSQQQQAAINGATLVNGELVAQTLSDANPVAVWSVMTVGDAGLAQAIHDFIDTSKEGVKSASDLINGREKKMVYTFIGTVGKTIKPDEIGSFEVIFKYPPHQ